MAQVLGCKVTAKAIDNWRYGRSPLPSWAALELADEIERRVKFGAELVERLRNDAERPRKVGGLQIIDPETGLRMHQFRGGHHEAERKAGPVRRGERKI